jgi:hypothetical protein
MPKANETAISVMCGGVQMIILSTQDVSNSEEHCFVLHKHNKIDQH